jgi:Fe-S cluster biogenesis protein NfuA
MDTKKIEEQIKEILDNLQCILDSHEGCAELIEVKDNKAVLFCGGKCAGCDNKCVVDAIKEKLPDIEVILR